MSCFTPLAIPAAPGADEVTSATPGTHTPGTHTITGEVVDTRSRWTARGDVIVTDVAIRTSDGTTIVASQLGGRVDGIGMVTSHHPPVLRAGHTVRAVVASSSARLADWPGRDARALAEAIPLYALRGATAARPAASQRLGGEPTTPGRYGVNRTNDSGVPLYWPTGCIHLAYDANGTTDLPDDQEFAVIEQSLREWEDETSVCSGLSFSTTQIKGLPGGRDFINAILWREDVWCRPETPTEPELCHDPAAVGVTTVYFVDNAQSPFDGQIVEADIEFNAVGFALAHAGETLGTGPTVMDLESTAAHELGHLLGLAHNCWYDDMDQPTDHQGNLVPRCADVDPGSEFAEATMFFLQDADENKKATLESSDVLGGCATLDGQECQRVVRGSCDIVAEARPITLAGLALLWVLAWFAVWTCRRRGRSGARR